MINKTQNTKDKVAAYNDEVANWHFASVTMGSLKRPRVTLAQLVNGDEGYDHSNDNEKNK